MKVHLKFEEEIQGNSHISLRIDKALVGNLTMTPAQAVWFHHILSSGCSTLSPPGLKKIEFWSSGKTPQPTVSEIDQEVHGDSSE
jgi:hypothetical protein